MKTERITIRVTEYEKEILKCMAADKDIPLSQLVRQFIKERIQEE